MSHGRNCARIAHGKTRGRAGKVNISQDICHTRLRAFLGLSGAKACSWFRSLSLDSALLLI